ncbi:unnamed protein product [Cuscuta campestris]|uniref:CCHC-type domain-containing protein n=1 Tax=Cuscuta campestris TaxID=132261 RepID=A0A484NIM9_9ASTE|nr:unnamed protein product [Cuscuta campestris]
MTGMDGFGFDAHTGNGSSSETLVVNLPAGLGGFVGQTTPINIPFGSSAAVGSTPIITFVGSCATIGSTPVTSVNGPTAATIAMVTPLGLNMASAIPIIPSLEPNTGVFTSAPVRHPTVMLPANSVKEPAKFTGVGFKIWQQRMLFWLTTLNLARYLREDPPIVGENADEPTIQAKEAWIANNYTCLNLILNFLSDALYVVYSRAASAKELWTTLSNKYQAKDLGAKKFVVGKVLDFKMVDSKPVVNQAEELILILNDCTDEGMGVKGLTREKKVAIAKVNVVEHPPKEGSSKGPKPNKDKKKIGPKEGVAKTKFAGKCYNYGITGHRSLECRKKPHKKKKAAERYASYTYNQRNPTRLKKKKMDPRPLEQLKKAQFFELREEARQNGLKVTDEEIWYSLVKGHNAKNRVPRVGDYAREVKKINPSSKPRRSSTSSSSAAEMAALKEQNQRLQEQIDNLTSSLSLTIQEEIRKLYGGNPPPRGDDDRMGGAGQPRIC